MPEEACAGFSHIAMCLIFAIVLRRHVWLIYLLSRLPIRPDSNRSLCALHVAGRDGLAKMAHAPVPVRASFCVVPSHTFLMTCSTRVACM
jgi:hypothetical protein